MFLDREDLDFGVFVVFKNLYRFRHHDYLPGIFGSWQPGWRAQLTGLSSCPAVFQISNQRSQR